MFKKHDNIPLLQLIPGLEEMTRESVKSEWVLPYSARVSESLNSLLSELLEEKELMLQLRDEKFDVGIVELFDYAGLGG